ncbi:MULTISPECIES: hypothetical protein [Ralstonia]|nr:MULTISPECIES: hypothetical protein [Ralstonia]NPT52623.1 hypothetical protein [Ralstonia sp. 3N]
MDIDIIRRVQFFWHRTICKIKSFYNKLVLMGFNMSDLPTKTVGSDTFIDNELVLHAEVWVDPATDIPLTIAIVVKGIGLLWVVWSAGLENWLNKSKITVSIRQGTVGTKLDEVTNIPQKFIEEAKVDSDFIYTRRNKL